MSRRYKNKRENLVIPFYLIIFIDIETFGKFANMCGVPFKRRILYVLVILMGCGIMFSGSSPYAGDATTSRVIIENMLKSISAIKTLRYNLHCTERINGRVKSSGSSIKLQRLPRKIYMDLKGPELLWIEGKNNGMALVNPNAFPYFNLNLDPYGSILRKDQHHTIHEIGFAYMADIIQNAIKKTGEKFDKNFMYVGEEKFSGRICYKISINNSGFHYLNYAVKKGEDLVSIARKLRLSEYMILENNPMIKDYYSVTEGQQIKVPSDYAKLTILYIDKQNNMPIGNMVFDDKGLFESYEYQDLQLDTKMLDEEFSQYYKGYKF